MTGNNDKLCVWFPSGHCFNISSSKHLSGAATEYTSSYFLPPPSTCNLMASIQMECLQDPTTHQETLAEDHVALEICDGRRGQHDTVVASIKSMLETLPSLSSERSIYQVPSRLRQTNPKAYTPQVISIGPLHHGSPSLETMEQHKLRYLKSLFDRAGRNLEDVVAEVRTWEERARKFYAEPIKLDRDGFVQLMLVDGCFIIELLLRYCYDQLVDEDDDPFYGKPLLIVGVCRDLAMLENQLPLFVLEGLFKLFPSSDYATDDNITFPNLTRKFFNSEINLDGLSEHNYSSQNINHFVDFLRLCFIPPHPSSWPEGDNTEATFPPSATELHEAGVSFEGTNNKCFLDISFERGVLKIPHLEIWDQSEAYLRNIIAYEQCQNLEPYVMQYATFLDSLIQTEKDVTLLINGGIITNRMGSPGEVSELFNNICKEAVMERHFYFQTVSKELNDYRMNQRNRWMAILRREYCGTPWVVVSIIAGSILLLLTLLQTIFSGLSMHS